MDEPREIVRLGPTGRLSRREVIARLAMLGMTSSAIASALAGAGLRSARAAGVRFRNMEHRRLEAGWIADGPGP